MGALVQLGICLLNLAVAVENFLVASLASNEFFHGGSTSSSSGSGSKEDSGSRAGHRWFMALEYTYVLLGLFFAVGVWFAHDRAVLLSTANMVFLSVFAVNVLVYAVLAFLSHSPPTGGVLLVIFCHSVLGVVLCHVHGARMGRALTNEESFPITGNQYKKI